MQLLSLILFWFGGHVRWFSERTPNSMLRELCGAEIAVEFAECKASVFPAVLSPRMQLLNWKASLGVENTI